MGAVGQAGGGAHDYDTFVDWDSRLAREGPFFADVFAESGVHSVIDVGAGSARHAILFAGWGIDVTAVDPDESMLEQAEANIAQAESRFLASGGRVRVMPGGFGELARLGAGPADALTCTGNALPHVSGEAGLEAALADFSAALRPGGLLVLHLLNHSRLLVSRIRAIPPVVRDIPDGGVRVFLRVIGYPDGGETLDFDFVTMERDPTGGWSVSSRRSSHTALPLPLLDAALRRAGFTDIRAYGDHAMKPLDPERDESVLLTAVRSR